MGANSIRTNLSRDSTISEIRLCKSADIAHEYVHLIVEGPDDIRFLGSTLPKKQFYTNRFLAKLESLILFHISLLIM